MVIPADSNASSLHSGQNEDEEEEEDDYMSMTFNEPTRSGPETSIQRRARKQREGERKSKVLSKAEQAAKDTKDREQALDTSLDPSNKGYQLMAKLGFKGGALGKDSTKGRTEPIRLTLKEDRGGIGLDSEKKRKFREDAELVEKQARVDEGDYIHRIRKEREEVRLEGLIVGAMKVAERLDTEAENIDAETHREPLQESRDADMQHPRPKHHSKLMENTPIVWRGLVRRRRTIERERRMRYDLAQSLSRLPHYIDDEEDDEDRKALAKEEEQLEEEDPELDEFEALEPFQRLTRLVHYLRTNHWYCFWCKHKYPDASLVGCPGSLEEDHD